jgi:hypothetical protein
MKLDNSTQIIGAKLISVDDGKESMLFERPGSRCHFSELIRFKGYFIQLRLDWRDVKSGEPVLDADIWTEINGRKESLRKGSWHHTEKKFDEKAGMWAYAFKFRELELRLASKKTMAKTGGLDVILARYAPDAQKALHKLDEKTRESVRQRAIKLSKERGRDYYIRLEDVLDAKDELELKKLEG